MPQFRKRKNQPNSQKTGYFKPVLLKLRSREYLDFRELSQSFQVFAGKYNEAHHVILYKS